MTKIEGYIPAWLRGRIKRSVVVAIKHDFYQCEANYWATIFPLGKLYFEYYYSKEVIANYIEGHGPWGEEQNKQAREFKSSGG